MPHLHAIQPPLIDFSQGGWLVFYGTDAPVDKLFQLYDKNNVVKSVDEFLRQYPEVQRMAAYAVLALAGRYFALALENFLSYSPEGLSDQVWGRHVPYSLTEFKVDWENLVISAQDVPYDRFRYLSEIYKYGNTEDGVVFGRVFEFGPDPEFERLLEHLHKYLVFNDFIPTLFSETLMSLELLQFAPTAQALRSLVTTAQFRRVSPFYIESELSDYLYHTGIYHRFFENHSTVDAQAITRDFLNTIFDQKPEAGLCLISRYPWGEWFDKHSVTDLTIIGINPYSKQIWLFAVTDSD